MATVVRRRPLSSVVVLMHSSEVHMKGCAATRGRAGLHADSMHVSRGKQRKMTIKPMEGNSTGGCLLAVTLRSASRKEGRGRGAGLRWWPPQQGHEEVCASCAGAQVPGEPPVGSQHCCQRC